MSNLIRIIKRAFVARTAAVTKEMLAGLLQDIIEGEYTATQKEYATQAVDYLTRDIISLQEAGQALADITDQHHPTLPVKEVAPTVLKPQAPKSTEMDIGAQFKRLQNVFLSMLPRGSQVATRDTELRGGPGDDTILQFTFPYVMEGRSNTRGLLTLDISDWSGSEGVLSIEASATTQKDDPGRGHRIEKYVSLSSGDGSSFSPEKLDEISMTMTVCMAEYVVKIHLSRGAASHINFKLAAKLRNRRSFVDVKKLEAPIGDLKLKTSPPKLKEGLGDGNEQSTLSKM